MRREDALRRWHGGGGGRHVEAGAGLVGLLKLVLSLQQAQAAPNLHLQRLNPHIDAGGYALVLPTGLLCMAVQGRGGSMAVGVSSFGFGGTNSHAVGYEEVGALSTELRRVRVLSFQHTAYAWWDQEPHGSNQALLLGLCRGGSELLLLKLLLS